MNPFVPGSEITSTFGQIIPNLGVCPTTIALLFDERSIISVNVEISIKWNLIFFVHDILRLDWFIHSFVHCFIDVSDVNPSYVILCLKLRESCISYIYICRVWFGLGGFFCFVSLYLLADIKYSYLIQIIFKHINLS